MKSYVYTDKKDLRTRMIIVYDNGHITSKSYPRILMEEKLGRPLEPNEDVHHIDGNKLNNNLDNLAIVMHGEHQKQHSEKFFDTKENCCVCGKEFIFTAKQWRNYYADLRRGKHRGITCSRHCAYLFGTQEQFRRNSKAECGLNGEPSPNGNTVPNDYLM